MKWKIGNVKIDNQVVLAPMAGICDSAFRRIAKSMGCGLLSTEMVSDKALMYNNWKTQSMLYMTDAERPISQQIFGSGAESFKIAAAYIEENMKPDIIDINMGCPVTKVAVKAHINAVEIAKIVEDCGASAITVHPRTREERYGIRANWSIIKEVKENVSIPVIGNGDIFTCYDAKRMIDETGCDAIMIGRGVLGNPWLIKQCIDYLDEGIEPERVTLEERIEMIKRHAELLSDIRPEKVAMHKMRTHAAYYLKGRYRSAEIKPRLFKMNTKEELFDLLDEYVDLVAY